MNFSVNAKGDKIMTDILVSGYIRQKIMDLYELNVPIELIKLCFLFWYSKTCDTWDESLCHQLVEINKKGTCFKFVNGSCPDNNSGLSSVFGNNCIHSSEIFTWNIRFNTKVSWACIGIIKDDQNVLYQNITDNNYGRDNPGCFLTNHGTMCFEWNRIRKYCDRFDQKGDLIEMTLNMKEHTLSYKINGMDYGIAHDKLMEDSYRLVVSVSDRNEEIELL